MKKWMTYSIALTFALWGGQDAQAAGPVFVDENADGIDDNVRSSYHRGRKGVLGRRGGSSQLTEAQREELKTLVDGLKESDTSKEDIRTAVDAKLEEWDVERSERGLDALLTEDQEIGIRVLIEWLRAEGKSEEEIRTAVNDQLEEWGVERPERGLASVLTEDQETALKTLIDGLKASDTSKEDIRTAVDAKLEEWGVERPERSRGGKRGHGKHVRRGKFRGGQQPSTNSG